MKKVAVIIAGGQGERFWPKSRKTKPKQFLSLTSDGETLIQKTIHRVSKLVDAEDIFVLTNQAYFELVKEQAAMIREENIIFEPASRNTAPCIALAASIIEKRYGEAIMLVFPSDHLIRSEQLFIATLNSAVVAAENNDNLITIGITPAYPETGYGYIKFAANTDTPGVYHVERFTEKPDSEAAKNYVSSGEYLWNSGMFVWRISTIINALHRFLPDIMEKVETITQKDQTDSFVETLNSIYPQIKGVSIDYGIMEKADNVSTIPGNYGWDDVGTWGALERVNGVNEFGNYIAGDVVTINTRNVSVCGNTKLIALLGVEDIVVVDTDDAILICAKDSTQDVKKIVDNLKICNRNEVL